MKENKNLMPEVAKLLGVEIGEEFKIKMFKGIFYIKDNVLIRKTTEYLLNSEYTAYIYKDYCLQERQDILLMLILGRAEIIKLPKLSEAERFILENLPKEYKWITRDEDNGLSLFDNKPYKNCINWSTKEYSKFDYEWLGFYDNIFQFIKWEDEEPYNIKELLKE